jgi:hypothetical protein
MTTTRLEEISNHIQTQLDDLDYYDPEVTQDEKELLDYVLDLRERYDLALELLDSMNTACDVDECLREDHLAWCDAHCEDTHDLYKCCWDRLIKSRLGRLTDD